MPNGKISQLASGIPAQGGDLLLITRIGSPNQSLSVSAASVAALGGGSFTNLATGTNTAATFTIGNGASLTFSGITSPVITQLATASAYAILGASAVTNSDGASTIISGGNIGSFPTNTITPGSPPWTLSGAAVITAVAQNQTDLAAAIATYQAMGPGTALGVALDGLTLTPGVYSGGTFTISGGTLTLNGAGVYVFLASTTIGLTSASTIILAGGATAANVVFVCGSSFTAAANAGTVFNGNILAHTSITVDGGIYNGRLLANIGAVTISTATTIATPVGSSLGIINANEIFGVVVSGIAPTAGQVLTATSATTANWQTPTGGGGGSGTVTHTGSLTSNAIILGNGSADIKPGAVLPGNAALYYDGTGNFSTPGGGGSVNSLFSRTYYTTSQRALNAVYHNTTGQPIIVSGWAVGTNANAQALTDSNPTPTTVVLDQYTQSGYSWNFMFMVAAGDYYEVSLSGGTPISWTEWEISTGSVTFSGDLSGSRAVSTVYQNTSGKAMLVLIDLSSVGSSTNLQGISDSNASPTDVVYNVDAVGSGSHTFWMMVPNNHYYKVVCSGAAVQHWNEYSLPFNATKSIDYTVAPSQRKLQISSVPVIDGVAINGQCKDMFISVSDAPSQTGSLIVDSGMSLLLGGPFDASTMSNNTTNHSACAIFVMLGEFYSARQDAGAPTLVHWWEYALA